MECIRISWIKFKLFIGFAMIIIQSLINIALTSSFFQISISLNYINIFIEILYILQFSIFFFSVTMNYNGPCYNKKKLLKEYGINPEEYPTVDILIPRYKEEMSLIKDTIYHTLKMDYPKEKINIYVCDDGHTSELKTICDNFKINYCDRGNNRGAKAGNVNFGLESSKGDFVTILDCDMRPIENYLQILIPNICFIDENNKKIMLNNPNGKSIGLVQTPQDFRNYSKKRDFFDMENAMFTKYIMPALSSLNIAPYIGTNAIMRRDALKCSNGFIQGYSTEDVMTSLHMVNNGWITKYVYSPVAYGITPTTVASAFDQRIRWAKGSVQLCRYHNPIYMNNLTFSQKLAYLSLNLYWMFGYFYLFQLFNIFTWMITITRVDFITEVGIPESGGLLWMFLFGYIAYLIFFFVFLDYSILTFKERIRCLQMFVSYWPVYLIASMSVFCTRRIRVQSTQPKSGQEPKWHPLFLFNFGHIIGIVVLTGIDIVYGIQHRVLYAMYILTIFYTLFYNYPIIKGLCYDNTNNIKNHIIDVDKLYLNIIGISPKENIIREITPPQTTKTEENIIVSINSARSSFIIENSKIVNKVIN